MLIMTFAGVYEIIEWGAAEIFADGSDAFLGTQGDVWDAQKDMVLAGLGGAITTLAAIIYFYTSNKKTTIF